MTDMYIVLYKKGFLISFNYLSCRSLADCTRLFPGRTNIDIIYGRPAQTMNDWKMELNKV